MSKRSNVYLMDTIKRVLKHGIYLGDESDPDEYLSDLCDFFNKKDFVSAIFEAGEVILEAHDWRPIMSFKIEQSTLFITPLGEADFFQGFLDVLQFVCLPPKAKLAEIKKQKQAEEEDGVFDWI